MVDRSFHDATERPGPYIPVLPLFKWLHHGAPDLSLRHSSEASDATVLAGIAWRARVPLQELRAQLSESGGDVFLVPNPKELTDLRHEDPLRDGQRGANGFEEVLDECLAYTLGQSAVSSPILQDELLDLCSTRQVYV